MPNLNDPLYGIQSTVSSALENSHVLITPTTLGFGGPFTLYNFTVVNYDTIGYLVLIFDSATLPANGTVAPVYNGFIAAGSATVPAVLGVSWGLTPLKAKSGIVIAGSTTLTTPFTLAVGTNNKLFFYAQVLA